MRAETLSVGDEVRFAPSPDVIDDKTCPAETSYHPDLVRSSSQPETPLRMQVVTNKQGFLELNLSQYDLSDLPQEVYNFSRLEVLKVNNNRLQSLPAAISYLRRLRRLDAHHNLISLLPDTLVNCTHLHELDLSSNRLATFPRQLSNLHSLRTLRLSHNQYTSLPHELGDLENLRHLTLAANSLWHLPFSFSQLRQLQVLDLSDNAFTQLPICICSMKHLEHLDLHGNRLINMPSDLENLKFLQNINLASNRLETVPYAISNLKNLQTLNLAQNKIKSLPARLNKLVKLKILMAQGNAIGSLPNNLQALEYLNVAHNNLRHFSVAHMRSLRYLNANNNYLENLPLGVCNVMPLEELKLNNNRISYISQDIVLLKRLRTLHVAHNALTSLPSCINEMESLENFNVKGNKLDTRVARRDMQLNHPQQQQPGYPPPRPRHKPHKQRRAKSRSPTKPDLVQQLADTDHEEDEEDEEDEVWFDKKGRLTHQVIPPSDLKPKRKLKPKKPSTPAPHKPPLRDTATQFQPHSRHISTQYTPKSSAKQRGQPPLDYRPVPQSQPDLLRTVPVRSPQPSSGPPTTLHHVPYDIISTSPNIQPVADHPDKSDVKYTADWLATQKVEPHSIRSNAATVNDTVGDGLSLGEEDFDFQPVTVTDQRLMGVCTEVEAMLNKQLMNPITQKGIFRKGLNEGGTLKTLNSMAPASSRNPSDLSQHALLGSPDGTVYMTEDVFMRPPVGTQSNLLQRTKADVFKVTPAGGLFKSSLDANVTLYFPVQATEENITIIMQLELVNLDALNEARERHRRLANIISMATIVHISMDKEINFNEQVTLTIPAPPGGKKGKLHILTYHEDNSCTPCTSPYKVYRGYITTQAWHFSGRGAVLTKSRSHHKACKAVESLLHKLYV